MRTTVTIDPDVHEILRQAMQRTGKSFKATLNSAVRKGLADELCEQPQERFVVRAKEMGLRPGIDPRRLQDYADEMEVEAYLEVTRKLEERHAKRRPTEGAGRTAEAEEDAP